MRMLGAYKYSSHTQIHTMAKRCNGIFYLTHFDDEISLDLYSIIDIWSQVRLLFQVSRLCGAFLLRQEFIEIHFAGKIEE